MNHGKAFLVYGFDAQQRGWLNDSWSPAPETDDGRLVVTAFNATSSLDDDWE